MANPLRPPSLSLVFPFQSSQTPYYTFYYDTGCSDEEEVEEQVLRNTVNTEALMTAFSHGCHGDNNLRSKVHTPVPVFMRSYLI